MQAWPNINGEEILIKLLTFKIYMFKSVCTIKVYYRVRTTHEFKVYTILCWVFKFQKRLVNKKCM